MRVRPGVRIDRFRVLALLGRGGMAEVWLVRHEQLETLHALKVLHRDSPGQLQRLVREGRVQGRLRHRHVVSVTDIIDVAGRPGLVMTYVQGPTLGTLLRAQRLSTSDVDALVRPILAAVAAAHAAGMVHRDLKPGNVLLGLEDGQVVPMVADFGLAKLLSHAADSIDATDMPSTRSGLAMGTPAYMAPEQIRDASRVDARADVFALGCLLYEMLAGERAFVGNDSFSVASAIIAGKYPDVRALVPDIEPNMYAAVEGALRTDASERVADAARLREIWIGVRTDAPVISDEVRQTVLELTRDPVSESLVDPSAVTLSPAVISSTAMELPERRAVATDRTNVSAAAATTDGAHDSRPVAEAGDRARSSRSRARAWLGAVSLAVALAAAGVWWISHRSETAASTRADMEVDKSRVLAFDSVPAVFDDARAQEQLVEGWQAFLAADFRAAERFLVNALEHDSADPLPWLLLGETQSELGNEAQSVQALWTAVERARTFESPYSVLLPLLRRMAMDGAWAGEVEDRVHQYLAEYPDDMLGRIILVGGVLAIPDDEIPPLFEELVARAPRHAITYDSYASDRLERGAWAVAREVANRGLEYNPDHPALLQRRGLAELHLGEFEAARRTLSDSVRLDPGQLQARVALAGAATVLGDRALEDELRTTLMGSTTSLADKIVYAREHALVLASAGRQEEAISLLDQVIAEARQDNAWEAVLGLLVHLDDLYQRLGQPCARVDVLERMRAAMNAPELAALLRQRLAEMSVAREAALAAHCGDREHARTVVERFEAVKDHNPGDLARLQHQLAVADRRPEDLHPELFRDSCDSQAAYLTDRVLAGDRASRARLEALLAAPEGCSRYSRGLLGRMRARQVLDAPDSGAAPHDGNLDAPIRTPTSPRAGDHHGSSSRSAVQPYAQQ